MILKSVRGGYKMLPEDDTPEGLYNKEKIEMDLMKIPEILKRLDRLEKENIIMNKRIKKMQEVKKNE